MSEDLSFVSVDNETEVMYSQNINVENTYSNYFKNERTTRPYITKFEKAKIIGVRAEQLAVGAKANIIVPEYLTDVRKIAENEFYENLYNAIGEVMIGFKATVVGYGDEYTDCYYSLTDKGWNVDYADLYVWNEDEQEYEES